MASFFKKVRRIGKQALPMALGLGAGLLTGGLGLGAAAALTAGLGTAGGVAGYQGNKRQEREQRRAMGEQRSLLAAQEGKIAEREQNALRMTNEKKRRLRSRTGKRSLIYDTEYGLSGEQYGLRETLG